MFDFVRTHTRILQFVLVLLIFPSFVFFGIQGYSRFTDGGNAAGGQGGRPDDHAGRVGRRAPRAGRARAPPDARHRRQAVRHARDAAADARRPGARARAAGRRRQAAPGRHRRAPAARLLRPIPQFAALRKPDGSSTSEPAAAARAGHERPRCSSSACARTSRMRQVLRGVARHRLRARRAAATAALDALLQQREVQVQRFDAKDYAGQGRSRPTPSSRPTTRTRRTPRSSRRPSRPTIEYVVLDLEALKKGITVPEDDLRKYYERERGALHRARGAPRQPHPDQGRQGRAGRRAREGQGQGRGAAGRGEEEPGAASPSWRARTRDDPGSAAAGRRPRLLRPRRDGQALRGRGLRAEARRDQRRRRDRLRLPHHPARPTCAAARRSSFEAVRAEIEDEVEQAARADASSPRPPTSSPTRSTSRPTA